MIWSNANTQKELLGIHRISKAARCTDTARFSGLDSDSERRCHQAVVACGSSSGATSSGGGSSSGDAGPTCLGDEGGAPACTDRIVECLETAPTCEEGEGNGASSCARDAVSEACPDDVEDYCTQLAAANECDGHENRDAFIQACQFLAPALTTQGRTGLTECLGFEPCEHESYCFDPSYGPGLVPFEN